MWTRLSSQHLQNSIHDQHAQQTRFFDLKFKPENDMLTHLTEIESIAKHLRDIGAPLTPLQVMTKVFSSLPPSYRNFISAWDSVPIVERSMATLTQRLLKEEAMNKQWGITETMDNAFFSPPTHNTNHGATSQERGSTSQERGRGSRGRRGAGHKRPRVVCHYCGIAFHTANATHDRSKECFNQFQTHRSRNMDCKGHWWARLYVRGLGTNLLSIGAVTYLGVQVIFTGERAFFSRNGSIEMIGKRVGKTLYYLNILALAPSSCPEEEEEAMSVATQPSYHSEEATRAMSVALSHDIWHQRLAHVNHHTINKMLSQQLVDRLRINTNDDRTTVCDGCAFGKMHRLPFPTGRIRGTQVGQLIHSDVCGPMQTTTPGGARYYVLFKDDLVDGVLSFF